MKTLAKSVEQLSSVVVQPHQQQQEPQQRQSSYQDVSGGVGGGGGFGYCSRLDAINIQKEMLRTSGTVVSERQGAKTSIIDIKDNINSKKLPLSRPVTASAPTSGAVTAVKSPFFHPSSKIFQQQRQSTQSGYQLSNAKDIVQDDEDEGDDDKRKTVRRYNFSKSHQNLREDHVVTIEEHKSTIVGAVSNLVTAIVGCGIVGIPYALKQSGFVSGILLIIVTASFNEKTLRLLISTAKHVHVSTYETAMEVAFGNVGFRFTAFNMLIVAYGAMVSYLMMIRDTFSIVFGLTANDDHSSTNTYSSGLLLVGISCCILLPISCQRDMADLASTSRMSVIIDVCMVLIIAWSAALKLIDKANHNDSDLDYQWSYYDKIRHGLYDLFTNDVIHVDSIFIGLGVLSFAYVCQHAAFVIAGSLQQPTYNRWSLVTRSALSFCACLSLVCGISGYVGYRDDTAGNVLNNLDHTAISATIARIMLGTTMLFVYPLECFVARHVLIVLFFRGTVAHDGNNDSTILNRRDRRYALTLLIYICTLLPALGLTNMGTVFALTGAIGGSCLSYIGPGILFLGIHGESFLKLIDQSSWWRTSATTTLSKDRCCEMYCARGPRHYSQEQEYGDSRLDFHAVEHTPLVQVVQEQLSPPATNETHTSHLPVINQQTTSVPIHHFDFSSVILLCKDILVYSMKSSAWYIIGMPLWCGIARVGQRNVAAHVLKLSMTSHHPIRIGDVEYEYDTENNIISNKPKRRHGNTGDSDCKDALDASDDEYDEYDLCNEEDERNKVRRSIEHQISLPLISHSAQRQQQQHEYNHFSARPSAVLDLCSPFDDNDDANTAASSEDTASKDQLLLDHNNNCPSVATTTTTGTTTTAATAVVEPDPQHNEPTWFDFSVAVSFIVLGFIAMTAGLFSIQASGT